MHFDLTFLSRSRFMHTYGWALLVSCLIVGLAATLARASLNLAGALTQKPDIAVLLLLPQQQISHSELLRSDSTERDYLLDTKDGSKLARLKKGDNRWFVAELVQLHN